MQSLGFFIAAFFYSIYCIVLIASNTWDFLTWKVIIMLGFTVSVASILPPAYHIYVHHKIFSDSVANADQPANSDENPHESFIHLGQFEMLSRVSMSSVPRTKDMTSSVNSDPMSQRNTDTANEGLIRSQDDRSNSFTTRFL